MVRTPAFRSSGWLPKWKTALVGIGILALVVAAYLAWPRNDHGEGGGPSGAPALLTFSPAKAPPAAPVLLSGVPAFDSGELEVRIGGHLVPAQRMTDGRIQAHVPVLLGDDGWPQVPRGGQAIEVRRSGVLVARSGEGLHVLELERAPGTTARVQRALEDIVAGYALMFESLPSQGAEDMAHRRAVVAALRGLVSEGDRSLAAVVAGQSPWLEGTAHDLELTDALLASSGAAGHFSAQAGAFGAARPAGAALPVSLALPLGMTGARCREGGEAFELACQMQAHGLITDLSQYFIKPTADTYADIVGLALAAAGVDPATSDVVKTGGRNVMAVHQIISALLSVVNFTMEKIAPSLLPSVLSSFELEVDPNLIRKGEMTRSRLIVEARNQPQTITANDLVDLVKSILGLPGLSKPFEKKVVEVGFYVIDLYMAALRRFGIEPSASMNPEVFTMPLRTWGPIEVEDADLVELFSFDTSVLEPRDEDMEWRGVGTGMATVHMRPRGGGRAKVLEDHTLCLGCVWSGGAFGEEMATASEQVAVDVGLRAEPPRGRAPHGATLSWTLMRREDRAPRPCTVDFGDGTAPERIADCSATKQVHHVYRHTSRLEADGAWKPKIRVEESGLESETEVFTDWTFSGSPDTGQAPVKTRFRWNVPWPADRRPPSCEFDPGDGSGVQPIADCIATDRVTHTFERGGSFVPTLTLLYEGRRDSLTAPVSVAEENTCDADLLKHTTWKGSVSYSHSRDVRSRDGRRHLRYSHRAALGAEMQELTRRTDKAGDYLVQYYSPLPEGAARVTFSDRRYSGLDLRSTHTFSGTGRLKRQEPDMVEEGSMLTLTVNARNCTYKFMLQAEVFGNGRRWRSGEAAKRYTGYRWINSVRGEGAITSPRSISGSGPAEVLSYDQIGDSQFKKPPLWVNEMDPVPSLMRGSDLGTVFVTWHFEPVE